MTVVTVLLAFLAGIVSFVSPCCLPLVPAYVSYMVGTTPPDSPNARRIAFNHALAYVLGFTIVFVGLWASIGLVGYLLRDYVGIMRQVGGAIIIVMGLHVAGLIRISALYRQVTVPTGRLVGVSAAGGGTVTKLAPNYGRSTLMGMAFAAGWTPCVGPILGGIIGLASLNSRAWARAWSFSSPTRWVWGSPSSWSPSAPARRTGDWRGSASTRPVSRW